MLIGKGTFSGAGGHTLTGSFTLTQRTRSILFETSDDFFFDGSPEPGWALSVGKPANNTDQQVITTAQATRFGDLPGGIVPARGRYPAIIPDTIDLNDYDTIFLWCFRVPFILGTGLIERIAA